MSPKHTFALPKDLENLRTLARRAISPITPDIRNRARDSGFWLASKRTNAGRKLPPYYLVYFLFVDLLQFPQMGRWEKVAWSVPIDFNGETYTIEHRKFGLGLFTTDPDGHEEAARRIVSLVRRGVALAEPFFEWLASTAVHDSKLNVVNHASWLFERYRYLKGRHDVAEAEVEARKHERREEVQQIGGTTIASVSTPSYELMQHARWVALAAIDAFFSWTEHLFVHLAILQGHITTGEQVAEIAGAEWQTKFKTALDVNKPDTKKHFDKLIVIRQQLRNFTAHGAFGKRGEAFQFHSGAGAVPVLLIDRPGHGHFALSTDPEFAEATALQMIEDFIIHLWSGARAPARIYLEDYSLPTILTMASDGTYAASMKSVDEMEEFVGRLVRGFDNMANMDW